MSTPNITPSAKYSGNGVATEFAVPFPYLDKSYVSVYVKRGSATQVKLLSTDFDFTNDTYIVYPKAGSTDAVLTSNDVIVVKRETPVKSDYVFDNQVRLFPEDVMDADDLGFQMIQEQADELNRAVKVSETSSANPDEIIPVVESIYSNLTQISAVGDNIGDINTCASNITDINTSADNIASINTNATNISAINTNATNISAIQSAELNAQLAVNASSAAATSATNAASSATNASTSATLAGGYATSASTSATNANNAMTSAQNSATSAQNWAVGTLAQQPEGSAKYWAESIDVNNLLKTNQITNCITEIPQDIKLELNNGTITLKAGSKCYMGDGSVRNTTGTLTIKTTGSAQMYLHITYGGTYLSAAFMTGGTVSERPSSPINYATYYNTSTQKCEYYNGSTWAEVSLPIAIVTRGADGFTSIDQVFNGFGYIGSTFTVKAGLCGLAQNGYNADGTIKNVEIRLTSYKYDTPTGAYTRYVFVGNSKLRIPYSGAFFQQSTTPTTTSLNGVWFNTSTKKWYGWNGTTWEDFPCIYCGTYVNNGTAITSLTPEQPVQLVKMSDKKTVVGWGMPDYSAGIGLVESQGYVADIDCYVLFSVRAVSLNNDTGFYINDVEVAKLGNSFSGSDDWCGFYIPKGTAFKAIRGTGTTAIYAKYPLKGVN